MKIIPSISSFKKKHKNKRNQILFCSAKCKSSKIIENLIDNFLVKKNSFIFESVEKRRIKGRYTIIGADPDKIWEFNNNKIYLFKNNNKKIIEQDPYNYLKKHEYVIHDYVNPGDVLRKQTKANLPYPFYENS